MLNTIFSIAIGASEANNMPYRDPQEQAWGDLHGCALPGAVPGVWHRPWLLLADLLGPPAIARSAVVSSCSIHPAAQGASEPPCAGAKEGPSLVLRATLLIARCCAAGMTFSYTTS